MLTCFIINDLNEYVTIAGTRVFCQAPSVFLGDPAKVTCYFPEDLSLSRTSFGVYLLDSNVLDNGE